MGHAGALPAVIPVISNGYLAVDLFFTLSGYVLAMTYGRQLERFRVTGAAQFYVGRLFRILPLHWFALLLVLLNTLFMPADWTPFSFRTAGGFVASLFLVQGWIGMPWAWNSPSWSLSAEWFVYLCFPLLAVISQRVRGAGVAAIMVLAPLVALTGFILSLAEPSLDGISGRGMVRCICEFTAGVFLHRLVYLRPGLLRRGGIAFLVGLGVLGIALYSRWLDFAAPFAFVLILIGCVAQTPIVRAVMANRLSKTLGDLSFSIYLLHWLMFEGSLQLLGIKWVSMPAATAMTVSLALVAVFPAAWLSWRLIEIPGQNQGRRVVRSMHRHRMRSSAGSSPSFG